MINQPLSFKINDGKKWRQCTYDDLWIIIELKLHADVYSNTRRWFGLRRVKYSSSRILVYVYAATKAVIMQNKGSLPSAWINAISIIDYARIHSVVCKDLHKYTNSGIVDIIMEYDHL